MADRTAPVLGSGKDTVTLDAEVFGAPFNGPLVHEVVVAELAARRRGTHATRTRGMVRGGGAKPWRQKGTGRARAGSSRSPLWTGGGITFGPSPRHYTVKVNRKGRRAALRSALSVHVERGSLAVLDAASLGDTPSTKAALGLLEGRRGGSVVVVVGEQEAVPAKSFRNLEGVQVLPAGNAGVADVVSAATLVLSRDALSALSERARKVGTRGHETKAEDAARPTADAVKRATAKAKVPTGADVTAADTAVDQAHIDPADQPAGTEEAGS
jgi:large subunit ribosomal protein L4